MKESRDIEQIADRILDYLKRARYSGQCTYERPAQGKDIVEAAFKAGLKITERDVSMAVKILRRRGEPIGTYFYALSANELQETFDDLTRRLLGELETRQILKRTMEKMRQPESLFHPVVESLKKEMDAVKMKEMA